MIKKHSCSGYCCVMHAVFKKGEINEWKGLHCVEVKAAQL